MSYKPKLHAQRKLPYDSPTIWTKCGRYLESLSGIAAFEEGVTCKACRAAIEWDREHNTARAAQPPA
jgi:hypothetical protein